MIWPFLVIYLGDELSFSLTVVTTLTTINAVASILLSFLARSKTDKLGGFMNDTFSLSAIWYGVGAAGFLGAMIFFILATRTRKSQGKVPAS